MTDHIRWGILGASGFAQKIMAPALNEARRSRLVALATHDPARAESFAAIAPGLRVHDSYDALLADPGIDAVYIPLPNALHVEWSIRAARAGKAVLCEKPIALCAADFDALIAARDATGCLIAEAWMPAHHPQWALVRDLIAEGALGTLHTVTGVFTYGLDDPGNIRLSADLAGGALRDVGVYPIGSFRFATGLEPEILWADAFIEGGVDTSAWVQARAGATRFGFHVSMRATRYQSMVFEGSRARLSVVAPFNPGQYGQADVIVSADDAPTRVHAFPDARQYARQVEAFAASLLDGVEFAYPLEAARGTQVALDGVFAWLEQKGNVYGS
jgi:predicted dehydrogenase